MIYDSDSAAFPAELQALVERTTKALVALSDQDVTLRAAAGSPSPKEVLGHLVDAATHSQLRLEQALEQGHLVFETGEHDETPNYGEADWSSLVTLWWMSSTHLIRTLSAISDEDRRRPHTRHNFPAFAWLPVPEGEPVTLDDLMWDYADHLQHHLAQLLPELAQGVPSSVQSV